MIEIKLLTYNIHKGFSLGGRRFVLHKIRDQIREVKPDIICLQEVAAFREQENQFEYLAEEGWQYTAYGKNAFYPKGHHGNAILSRHPIKTSLNTDLSTNRLEKRGLLHVKVELPDGRPAHILNTHLSLTAVARKKQILQICNYVKAAIPNADPILAAGDYNDWGNRLSLSLSQELNMSEIFQTLNGQVQRTYPSGYPILALDRIYYRMFTPITAEVLTGEKWSGLSDHLPLLATFQSNNEAQ
jgi:endonuclease/exonuclease/phosphatase family metal-dependent hydrolase